MWDGASVEYEGAGGSGDRIALDFRVLVRARQTDRKVELRGTNVFEFAADGRIARLDSFNDAGAAAEWLAEKRP